jgi:hypothetical protein
MASTVSAISTQRLFSGMASTVFIGNDRICLADLPLCLSPTLTASQQLFSQPLFIAYLIVIGPLELRGSEWQPHGVYFCGCINIKQVFFFLSTCCVCAEQKLTLTVCICCCVYSLPVARQIINNEGHLLPKTAEPAQKRAVL